MTLSERQETLEAEPGPRPLAQLVQPVRPVRTTDRVAEAARRIVEAEGGLPVVDEEEKLAGYISERALLAAIFPSYLKELRKSDFIRRDFASLLDSCREAAAKRVEEIMVSEPISIRVTDSESHAAELFIHHGIRNLPVVSEEDRVVGVIRLRDVVKRLLVASGAFDENLSRESA